MISYFIEKSASGSTAPSLGTRSRTWPYEAMTSKSLPRYFLIVFALAGDSTMTRFITLELWNSVGGGRRAQAYNAPICALSTLVQPISAVIDHVFHLHGGFFRARLVHQYEQHHPLHALDVDFVLERHQPVDHQLAILG